MVTAMYPRNWRAIIKLLRRPDRIDCATAMVKVRIRYWAMSGEAAAGQKREDCGQFLLACCAILRTKRADGGASVPVGDVQLRQIVKKTHLGHGEMEYHAEGPRSGSRVQTTGRRCLKLYDPRDCRGRKVTRPQAISRLKPFQMRPRTIGVGIDVKFRVPVRKCMLCTELNARKNDNRTKEKKKCCSAGNRRGLKLDPEWRRKKDDEHGSGIRMRGKPEKKEQEEGCGLPE